MDQGDAAQGDVPRRVEDRLDRPKKMPATRVAGISGDRRGSTRRFSNEHRTSAARCRQSSWPIRVITGPQPRVVVDHRAGPPHSTLACAAMAAQPPHPQIRIAERSVRTRGRCCDGQGGGRSRPLTNLGLPSRSRCPAPSRLPGRSSRLRRSQESGGAGRCLRLGTCCPGRTGQSRAPPRNPRGKRSRQART